MARTPIVIQSFGVLLLHESRKTILKLNRHPLQDDALVREILGFCANHHPYDANQFGHIGQARDPGKHISEIELWIGPLDIQSAFNCRFSPKRELDCGPDVRSGAPSHGIRAGPDDLGSLQTRQMTYPYVTRNGRGVHASDTAQYQISRALPAARWRVAARSTSLSS